MKPKIAISLGAELLKQIDALAKKRYTSRSALIENLLWKGKEAYEAEERFLASEECQAALRCYISHVAPTADRAVLQQLVSTMTGNMQPEDTYDERQLLIDVAHNIINNNIYEKVGDKFVKISMLSGQQPSKDDK